MRAVDPSAKKRIDDKIKEAKVALSAIEAEAGELTEEDAEIRQHEREYTTRMVRPPLHFLCISNSFVSLVCFKEEVRGGSKNQDSSLSPGK